MAREGRPTLSIPVRHVDAIARCPLRAYHAPARPAGASPGSARRRAPRPAPAVGPGPSTTVARRCRSHICTAVGWTRRADRFWARARVMPLLAQSLSTWAPEGVARAIGRARAQSRARRVARLWRGLCVTRHPPTRRPTLITKLPLPRPFDGAAPSKAP